MNKEIDFLNERLKDIQKELKFLGENYKFEYIFTHRISDKDISCESIIGSEGTYLLCMDRLSTHYSKFRERKRFDLVTRMKNFRVICVENRVKESFSNPPDRYEELEKGGTYLVTNVRNADKGLDFELKDLSGNVLSQNYSSFRFKLDDYTILN